MYLEGARVAQIRVCTRDEHAVGCLVHAHGAHVTARVGDGRRRWPDSRWSTDSRWFIPLVKPFMLVLSAALCSSTAFLSHQSDFSARVRFYSSLQASLYAAVVDLVLMVCNTLWWDWYLLLIRVCSSWLLESNQSWWFLSGLPRYVLAVLYTTCYSAAHSSSGVEFSFSYHWAKALSISCSKLSLCLTKDHLSFSFLIHALKAGYRRPPCFHLGLSLLQRTR